MEILLIEDLVDVGESMKDAISSGSIGVTWITGVNHILETKRSDSFEAISAFGGSVNLELSDFDLAFVDYELEGAFHGAELVPHLRKSGVVCVAISAKANLNGELCAAGAHLSVPKHALVTDIELGVLDFQEIVDTFASEVGWHEDIDVLLRKCLRRPN